jgi:hypothetical protein
MEEETAGLLCCIKKSEDADSKGVSRYSQGCRHECRHERHDDEDREELLIEHARLEAHVQNDQLDEAL